MIEPILKGETFLADVRAAREFLDQLHLWWLGQSGFLVQWNGNHLLLDPYLSDSLTEKYSGTDKPHVRMTERVIAPEQLDFIDVVTSSHHHTDHLDAQTLVPLLKANADLRLIIPEANRQFVADRLHIPAALPIGLNASESVEAGGFAFHAVPSAHELIETDDQGRHKFLGYVVEAGPWEIYHSGDTVLFPGIHEILRRWKIDVALLPINGRAPERRVAGNLNGREAATLAHEIGAKLVIPCHYEMFEFNTASPDEFVATADKLGQPYKVLRAGERWSST